MKKVEDIKLPRKYRLTPKEKMTINLLGRRKSDMTSLPYESYPLLVKRHGIWRQANSYWST